MFDVIIPTKNSSRTLSWCLRALKRSDIPYNRIIVIDKHSKDGTIAIAKREGCLVINSDANYSQSLREGIKIAETEYVLILDSDVIVNSCFYYSLKDKLDGEHLIVKGYFKHLLNWSKLSKCLYDRGVLEINALEAAFVLRKKFLELTKCWDTGFMDAGGDTWLYQKCKELNIPTYQSKEVINYHITEDFRNLFKQARWYGKSSKSSGLTSLSQYLWLLLKSPISGLVLAIHYRDIRLLPFYVCLRINYLQGYVFD